MKINSDLGYKPVPFSELTNDPKLLKGCQTVLIMKKQKKTKCACVPACYMIQMKTKRPS
jgi:hypothetical protein